MAETKTKTTRKSSSATKTTSTVKKTAPKEVVAEQAPVVIEDPRATFSTKPIDDSQYVTVRNGFQGMLVYVNSRTGEKYKWDAFGDEQDMQLRELKNAKGTDKKFFINNWFMFDDPWIIDYLGVGAYYKHSLRLDEFDELFKKSAPEIEETLSKLSEGQKKSVAYRAAQLISAGEIDSNKSIVALENALNIELIER